MPDNKKPAVTPPAVEAKGGVAPPAVSPQVPGHTVASDIADSFDSVDKWIAENPEPVAAAEEREEPAADLAPPVEAKTPDVAPPAETPQSSDTPTPSVEPTVAVEQKTPVDSAPKPTTEAPPAPLVRTFSDDERFALAANPDGSANEWTRKQIVEAIRDRHANLPKVAEADEFKRIFAMDAKQAKEVWEPVLQRLVAEPATANLINMVLEADPDKAEYLARAEAHYEEERAAGNVPQAHPRETQLPAQPQPQSEEQTLRRELAEWRTWRDQQAMAEATRLFNSQFSAAVTRYPFLATDDGLRRELCETASVLNRLDEMNGVPEAQRRGLPEAVEAKASIYDALLTARSAQRPPSEETIVPATLGGGGAAPQGTRPVDDGRPKIYRNGEDPVEEWLKRHPE
jgi:hypothetical protein